MSILDTDIDLTNRQIMEYKKRLYLAVDYMRTNAVDIRRVNMYQVLVTYRIAMKLKTEIEYRVFRDFTYQDVVNALEYNTKQLSEAIEFWAEANSVSVYDIDFEVLASFATKR